MLAIKICSANLRAMARPPRSFISPPVGPPQPVDTLKFAVVDDQNKLVSAVWTVAPSTNPKKQDIYVAASGVGTSAKFSFHKDVLNHSILNEVFGKLVETGVVNTPSRHQQSLSISSLPWHGLTVRMVPELLRKTGHSADGHNGTIVALPKPREGTVLEIGFILAEGPGLNIQGAQAAIGQVVSGGSALVVVFAFRPLDSKAHKADIERAIASIHLPDHVVGDLDTDTEMAAMLYGEEQGFMTVTEVHNVRYRRDA
jgi:methylglyoxal synthase